jgi:hypothetical protein
MSACFAIEYRPKTIGIAIRRVFRVFMSEFACPRLEDRISRNIRAINCFVLQLGSRP